MGERKFIAAVALAVAVVLALSGCAVTGSLVDKAGIDVELAQLRTQLEQVPSVTDVEYTTELQADYSYIVSMLVTSSAADAADTILIVDAVDRSFSSGRLAGQQRRWSLDSELGPLVSQWVFGLPPDRVAADIEYQFALAEAVGRPVAIGFNELQDGEPHAGDYQRSISLYESSAGLDWDALTAVSDPAPSETNSWGLGILGAVGKLPPKNVLQLSDRLQPLVQENAGWTWVEWNDVFRNLDVYLAVAETETGPFAEMALWPQVVAVATEISAAGLPRVSFSFQTNANSSEGSGTVHTGECETKALTSEQDEEFMAALAASGVVLPAGSGAGLC